LAPRPLGLALGDATGALEPPTLLARVQSAWAPALGEALAAESQPRSEADGVVTAACSSSLWAAELELLAPELVDALNAALGSSPGRGPVRGLRFVTGS
jgi:predicted nucleic acid-binding Zn ribbon protein